MLRKIFLAILFVFAAHETAKAMPGRTVGVGVGAGVPEIVFGQIDVTASSHWQIGFGYGLDGGLLGQALNFERLQNTAQTARTVQLSDGRTYIVTPRVEPLNLSMLTPSIRYFPTARNFYFQLSWTMARLSSSFSSSVVDEQLGIALDGVVFGKVSVLQHMPTISIGHIYSSKAFFANVRLGVSYPLTTQVSVEAKAQLPTVVGGNDPNLQALAQLATEVADEATRQVNAGRKNLYLIPSIALTFGFFL